MSAKRSRLELPASSQAIARARKALKAMPKARRIDLMVEAGVMTARQAERAKKKLAETQG